MRESLRGDSYGESVVAKNEVKVFDFVRLEWG